MSLKDFFKKKKTESPKTVIMEIPVLSGCEKTVVLSTETEKSLDETMTVRIEANSDTKKLFASSECVYAGGSSLQGTREYQQDALNVEIRQDWETGETRIISVLCDGMGGLEGGERASRLAVSRMMDELDTSWNTYPDIYLDAAMDVNYEVRNLRDQETGRKLEAGTTLTAASIQKNQLYWCSVGDSRIYLYRQGVMQCLTRDHIYGNDLDEMAEKGEITAEQAENTPGRSALTSYLGIRNLERINYNQTSMELRPGDVILQCSDGLYRSLSEMEMAYTIQRCFPDMQKAADSLTSIAVGQPGKHDNTSAVLLCYMGIDEDKSDSVSCDRENEGGNKE